jgi:hypothetical protein
LQYTFFLTLPFSKQGVSMSQLKKMYSNLNNPHVQQLMRLIETQSKQTLVNWCCAYALNVMLPVYQKHFPADRRPCEAVHAAKDWLDGKIKLPEAKKLILACHEAAREAEKTPAAQAAARAIGQAASSIHTVTHALGIAFYGAMAVAYNKVANKTQEVYNQLAEEELANIEASLRAVCVENESDPVKVNWNC